MKISGSNPKSTSGLGRSAAAGPAGPGTVPTQRAGQTQVSDRAQISSLGSYLASALNGSPAHVAKVNELGAAVSNGRYQVDAHAVSGSIIQHSIEFGGASYLSLNG
ncbi:MAG: flagellar biosynthesis anti-sigma factor FlgM [Bryobacteraceae bacterium]